MYMAPKRASRAAKGKAKIITIETATNQVDANANLKTASTTDISGKVKFLAKQLNEKSIERLINNTDRLVKFIDDRYTNANSRKAYYTAIVSLIKHTNLTISDAVHEVYYDKMMESLHAALEVAKENQPKVAGMQLNGKAIQWNDVIECEKKLRKDEYASRAHLLVAMYSLIPPRRLGDYQDMEVFKNKTEYDAATGNKMLINTRNKYADMSISDYKTSGIYETYEKRIQGVLFTIIKTSLAAEKRRYLFENTLGAPYVSGTFSKAVTDVFKRKLGASLGVNSLRHLKITAFIATNPNLHAREELA
jgi:hypothetical protein